ncbi:FAD-dependent oxidoreductase [Novosphingobium rosa]|uniref:FAD-dependent oxidoreductase n=1 Tax=Novosphingobium rosa TaxID=76978 RepID=UPI00082F40B8|nr:FAD-dependent oxidoreductase [Novosphingobium rosa]
MSDPIIECDLLVIGAGMAGLSAAGWAAERGARVIVVDRAPSIGGSAFLSGGVFWTATSPGTMALYAGGDPALGSVIFETYPDAIAWLRGRGIDITPRMNVLHGYGYQIDIVAHLRGCADLVEGAAGHVILNTQTLSLLRDENGAVIGARTSHADGEVLVHAPATILATGGYQASPDLRARFIHPQARDMRLRSNPFSDGTGLRLGEEAGGQIKGENPGFYGHLVSGSPQWGEERLNVMLSQYHSEHALLLNEEGLRFCDETYGDHASTYQTVLQSRSRALCFWDARVHANYATQAVVATASPEDKMDIALRFGGQGLVAPSIEAVARFAGEQGFNGAQVERSIAAYNLASHSGWETLIPPRMESCDPLDQAPFYALVVHPAITFTFGGLSIDTGAHVLDAQGMRIAGLFAAGSDAGGAFGKGYAGGLALAMTFGMTAARSAGWV